MSAESLKQLKASVMIAARKAGKPTAQAWQRVEKDIEIDRSMRSFAEAGVSVTYHACDVSNRAALAEVLETIRQTDGPIAGILHGAGVEKSCRFEKKTPEVVVPTIRVKVDGAANLMALTQRDPIRHFVLFGSISGRLGGFGQVDYSLANEMGCKLLGSYRRARPWVQAVGFHWHAWDGVGMAARPETKSLLESNGALALMPLEEGLAHLVREMAAGTPEAEVMITERHHWEKFSAGMGVVAEPSRDWVEEDVAATNGHTSSHASPVKSNRASAKAVYPMLGDPRSQADGASGEAMLDPAHDRFLLEHRLRGKPLLPVVVGLQVLAEAARAASGQSVIGFRNVDMIDGLTFHGDRQAVARASATRRPDGLYDCRLTADFHNRSGGLIQSDRLYLEALADTGASPLAPLVPIPQSDGEWGPFAYPEEAPIQHGPIFRGLTSGCCNEKRGTGQIISLPLADLAGPARVAGWSIPSCVLDAAFYACGYHLWSFGGYAVALPRRVEDLRLGRLPRDGEKCLVHIDCLDLETGDYDFDIVGEDGAMIVQARRFGQVIFARGYYGPTAKS